MGAPVWQILGKKEVWSWSLVGDAYAGLGCFRGDQVAPILVQFPNELADGTLKLFRRDRVLLRLDFASDQKGSVLKGLNESCVIDQFHTFAPIKIAMRSDLAGLVGELH